MFRRIGNLIKGFFSRLIGGVERRNPEALLEVEKENLREQIAKYNQGLAQHAALCERLISQVKRLESEEKELHAKTSAQLRAGNKELAGQYALRYQAVKKEHQTVREQMETAETTYQELKSAREVAVKGAREKIEALSRDINSTKIAKATADLNEMAAGMVTELGGAGETMSRLEEMVREEKDKAAGRARIARDSIDMHEIKAQAGEQKAMEDMALADFAAAEGIVMEKPEAAAGSAGGNAAPEKTMGPAQSEI